MTIIAVYFMLTILIVSGCRKQDVKKVILFLSIGFGILAFFQLVTEGSDLNTQFAHLNNIKTMGWKYFSVVENQTTYFSGKFTLKLYSFLISDSHVCCILLLFDIYS